MSLKHSRILFDLVNIFASTLNNQLFLPQKCEDGAQIKSVYRRVATRLSHPWYKLYTCIYNIINSFTPRYKVVLNRNPELCYTTWQRKRYQYLIFLYIKMRKSHINTYIYFPLLSNLPLQYPCNFFPQQTQKLKSARINKPKGLGVSLYLKWLQHTRRLRQ